MSISKQHEPHPGLGSGALREAFARWWDGGEWEIPNEKTLASDAFEAGWFAALSLSSPIEPDCEFVNGRCKYCDSSKAEVEATTGKCVVMDRPNSQASSEIREALDEMTELKRRMDSESGPKLWSYGTIYAYVVSRIEALTPSRQGAAKRVEG